MNAASPYSTLKAAWHLDRIAALRADKPVIPVEIQFVISDLCNHDCHFCAYRASDGLSTEQFADADGNKNPKRMIPYEKACEIIRDAASLGVKSIIFTGGGEPTVHPDHVKLFRLALDSGLECSLNTNGDVMRAGLLDLLPRFTYVRFSIDAGTNAEYSKIRKVPLGRYFKVMDNLRDAARVVKQARSGCIVGTGYVVTPENWVNLVKGVENVKDAGASYVRIASMQSTAGSNAYDGEMWRNCKEAIADAKMLADDSFQVIDLFDSAMGRRMLEPACGMQHMVLYIGANLKAYRCCYVAYTGLGECGDLSNTTLAEYVISPERRQALKSFDARSCGTCPLADKNAVIGYMAQEAPTHVNFV